MLNYEQLVDWAASLGEMSPDDLRRRGHHWLICFRAVRRNKSLAAQPENFVKKIQSLTLVDADRIWSALVSVVDDNEWEARFVDMIGRITWTPTDEQFRRGMGYRRQETGEEIPAPVTVEGMKEFSRWQPTEKVVS